MLVMIDADRRQNNDDVIRRVTIDRISLATLALVILNPDDFL